MIKTRMTTVAAMILASLTMTACNDTETEYVYVCDDGTEVTNPDSCPITDPSDPTDPVVPTPIDAPFVLAAQTKIDEAYIGITSSGNMYDPTNNDWANMLPPGYEGKRTAAYPWGTTTYGQELWFGTIAQGWCVWPYQNIGMDLMTTTYESEYTACSVPNTTGTPSQFYVYDFETGEQEVIQNVLDEESLKEYLLAFTPRNYGSAEEPQLANTFGFRASGTVGDLVFTAGHYKNIGGEGRLRLFVFNAKKREFVGYRDIIGDTTRRFRTLKDKNGNDGFYTIIGSETGMTQNGNSPTQMLRWVGTQDAPFAGGDVKDDRLQGAETGWEVVSDESFAMTHGMIGDWRQFTHTDGTERLIMSSAGHPHVYKYGNGEEQVRNPGISESVILLSNPIPEGGFTAANPMSFTEIFNMNRYDPAEFASWGHKWGTSAILDGYVYFGTYHQGNDAGYKHFEKAAPQLMADVIAREGAEAFQVNEWRASSIFRMKLADLEAIGEGKKDPELLYGYETMNIVDKDTASYKSVPNLLGQKPLYGEAGMGNPGNVYSWTSISKDGKLFWGFFDAFSGMHDLLNNAYAGDVMIPGLPMPIPNPDYKDMMKNSPGQWMMDHTKEVMTANGTLDDFTPGGDLVVFDDVNSPARVLTKDGFGNLCSNGVRNVVDINDKLYFGTSTWCNLSDKAGLEFYEYKPELDKK